MKDYSPPSDFLCMIDFEGTEIRFDGEFGARNLERLIALTRDDHPANRDWATFYLANLEVDSPEVREALLRAATDDHADTRAEAISGIARRNMPEAISLVRRELEAERVGTMSVEAAGYVADPALLPQLRELTSWWDVDEKLLKRAISACETGVRFVL